MQALTTSKLTAAILCGWLMTTCASTGWADDSAANAMPEQNLSLTAFDTSSALSADELSEERAKQRIEVDRVQINDQDLNGTVADNTAIGNNTGHNTISGDAFTGAAGFISSVQNSGNNVLIQNATIINVSVEP